MTEKDKIEKEINKRHKKQLWFIKAITNNYISLQNDSWGYYSVYHLDLLEDMNKLGFEFINIIEGEWVFKI